MKKRILSVMVMTTLMLTLFIGTNMVSAKTMATSAKKLKVGMAVQDLSNPIWAGIAQNLSALVKKNGGEMNYVSCDSNVSKQIQQIEDFIASGVNTILIQPADPTGVENVCKQARAAGIKVLSWDDNIKNCDAAYLIDNYKLGYMIGEQASQWINSKLGGVTEVAVLNYPQLPILLQRGNGIVAAIKKLSPKAKIVAQTSAINPAEGISKMETVFQSNPNVKVVACIGGGAAVGANEAAKAGKKITADFGIFAADATDQEIQAIRSNEGNRMSVMVTGGPPAMAKEVYGILSKLVAGQKIKKEVYRTLTPITAKNVDQYFKK